VQNAGSSVSRTLALGIERPIHSFSTGSVETINRWNHRAKGDRVSLAARVWLGPILKAKNELET